MTYQRTAARTSAVHEALATLGARWRVIEGWHVAESFSDPAAEELIAAVQWTNRVESASAPSSSTRYERSRGVNSLETNPSDQASLVGVRTSGVCAAFDQSDQLRA